MVAQNGHLDSATPTEQVIQARRRRASVWIAALHELAAKGSQEAQAMVAQAAATAQARATLARAAAPVTVALTTPVLPVLTEKASPLSPPPSVPASTASVPDKPNSLKRSADMAEVDAPGQPDATKATAASLL